MQDMRTKRPRLRPFRPDDLPHYAAMNADPRVPEFLGGPLTATASDRLAQDCNDLFAQHRIGMITIERRADGAFLGSAGLNQLDWYPNDLELGWRLAPQYWGQGYATEAGAAWIGHTFGSLARNRLISLTDAPNTRSIAVMLRLGFRFDHAARQEDDAGAFDAVIHALAAEDWAASGPPKR